VGAGKIQAIDRAKNFSGTRRDVGRCDVGIAWVAREKALNGRTKSTRERTFAVHPMRIIFR
jgi:hypothetical protein